MTSIGNPVSSPPFGATRPTALGNKNALETTTPAMAAATPTADMSQLAATPASQQEVYNAYILGAQQGQAQAQEDHKSEFQFGLKSAGHFVKGAVINPVVDVAKFATSGPLQFAATVGTGALLASSAGAALAPWLVVMGAGAAINYGAKFVGKLMTAENGAQRAEAFEDLGAATTSAFSAWKGAIPALKVAKGAGDLVKTREAAAATAKAAEAAKTGQVATQAANTVNEVNTSAQTVAQVANTTAETAKAGQTIVQGAGAVAEGAKTTEATKAVVSSLDAINDFSTMTPFQALKKIPGVLVETTQNAGKLAIQGESWSAVPGRMTMMKDIAKVQAEAMPGKALVAKDKAANWLLKVGHPQPTATTGATGSALATSTTVAPTVATAATTANPPSQGFFSGLGNFFSNIFNSKAAPAQGADLPSV
jgi:hypothetical protein